MNALTATELRVLNGLSKIHNADVKISLGSAY